MWRRALPLGTTLAALALVACGENTTGTGGAMADLKVVHAAPAVGAVDVVIGSSSVIEDLPFGQSSGIKRVPVGAQTLTFRVGSTTVAQVALVIASDKINAVTLNDDTAQVTPVTPDTGHAATNRANIRVINIASGNAAAPTLLQVWVNFPGVSPDSSAKLGLDSKIASHGPLMYFDPGHFRFRFVPEGATAAAAVADVEFDVVAGEKKAVVLERAASGAYSARVVIEP